jgi:hypothetical protein
MANHCRAICIRVAPDGGKVAVRRMTVPGFHMTGLLMPVSGAPIVIETMPAHCFLQDTYPATSVVVKIALQSQ